MRIATRLMKADNGFVIWSATYDRPVDDLLMVQDDIGEQVTRALKMASMKKAHRWQNRRQDNRILRGANYVSKIGTGR
jgi:hypothetical protein